MPDPTSPKDHRGTYTRGYLPHIDAAGLLQHITFHLADSLPAATLDHIRQEIEATPEAERPGDRRTRLQELLDAGHGRCLLRRPDCATIVAASLRFGHPTRYRLHAWVVMPNHCHVLIAQCEGWPLGDIVRGWKRHTTREIARLPETGAPPIWQRDYFDRFIRDQRQFDAAVHYIEHNPVKAGLVVSPEEWPWSSAYRGGLESGAPGAPS